MEQFVDLEIDLAHRVAGALFPLAEIGAPFGQRQRTRLGRDRRDGIGQDRGVGQRQRWCRGDQPLATVMPSMRQRRHIGAIAEFEIVGGREVEEHVLQIARDGELGDRGGDLAVLDQEARRAAAVIAGHAVDAHADQLGDEHAALDVGDQRLGQDDAGAHMHVAGRDAGAAPAAARCMAGRLQPELPGRGAVEQPGFEHAVRDELDRGHGQPSPSNGRERRPWGRCGSSQMVTPLAKIFVPSASSRKLVLREIAWPEMAPTRWPSMLEPTRGSSTTGIAPLATRPGLSRATARSPARVPIDSGILQLAAVASRMMRIIADHLAARSGEHAGRQAVAGRGIGAGKAVAGGERPDRARGAGAAAFAVRDAARPRAPHPRRRAPLPSAPRARRRRHRRDRAAGWAPWSRRLLGARGRPRASSGASRAMATARSASVVIAATDRSEVETLADRRPTNTRRPSSAFSERPTSSQRAEADRHVERGIVGEDGVGRVGSGGAGAGDDILSAVSRLIYGKHRAGLRDDGHEGQSADDTPTTKHAANIRKKVRATSS